MSLQIVDDHAVARATTMDFTSVDDRPTLPQKCQSINISYPVISIDFSNP